MATVKVYLVVNGKKECRLTKRYPALRWDEVAWPISIDAPEGWGRMYSAGELRLTVPAPREPAAPVVGEPELPESDSDG